MSETRKNGKKFAKKKVYKYNKDQVNSELARLKEIEGIGKSLYHKDVLARAEQVK